MDLRWDEGDREYVHWIQFWTENICQSEGIHDYLNQIQVWWRPWDSRVSTHQKQSFISKDTLSVKAETHWTWKRSEQNRRLQDKNVAATNSLQYARQLKFHGKVCLFSSRMLSVWIQMALAKWKRWDEWGGWGTTHQTAVPHKPWNCCNTVSTHRVCLCACTMTSSFFVCHHLCHKTLNKVPDWC